LGGLIQHKKSETLAQFVDVFFNSKTLKIIQNYSDLSHASSGAETEENALSHASSFSSRDKEMGNGVQKEGKTRNT